MGFGKILAAQVEMQVGMAKAGVISEADARQHADMILKHASPADRQEAMAELAAKAKRS
ncbi:hypothetical protein ACH4UM_23775 [Streptomyces sp. NPDC020801]|uniref:hypothetical protein n=1 Tax=Streptomyces sp. NPDC020801 TaxID=3365093 RepID=UPI0037980623